MTTNTLSIITVHLNDFEGLGRTQKSLHRTLCANRLEWVEVDGLSAPGSETEVEILKQAEMQADVFRSATDSGIYDAMNTGTHISSGSYLLYLNAGDELHPDFDMQRIFNQLDATNPAMLWASYDETGKTNNIKGIKPRSSAWLWWGMPTSHQAIFFRKETIGPSPYDTELKIAGDYDLVLRVARSKQKIVLSTVNVCIADATGVSNTELATAFPEQARVRSKYFGTSKMINFVIAASKQLIGWVGKFGLLRKIWK